MRTPVIISTVLHGAIIVLAAVGWGGPDPDDEPIQTFADVEVLTESAFEAATSRAPDFVPTEMTQTFGAPEETVRDLNTSAIEPDVEFTDADIIEDPSARDAEADLTAVRERPTVQAQFAAPSDVSPSVSLPTESASLNLPRQSPSVPDRPVSQRPQMNRPAPPVPSLNISTRADERPPEDARTAEERQEEIAEGETPTDQPVEEQEATAPEESASEIVPQIAEDVEGATGDDPTAAETEEGGVLTSAPPPPRPARPEAEEEVAEDETPAAEAEEPVETAAADESAVPADTPVGAPLTSGERNQLRSAIQQHWNIGILEGLPNSDELVVVVEFNLTPEGRVVNNEVRPVRPANPDGAYARAFDIARRAILQASQRGEIRLPPEKYAQWDLVEITFNPGNQTVGF